MQNRHKQVISRRVLTLDWCTRTKVDVASVGIPLILKGSSAQQRSFNVRHAIHLAIIQAFVSRRFNKNKLLTSKGNPKAHQSKAGTIHAHDSVTEEDSSDDSFCLQLKIQYAQVNNKNNQRHACLVTNLAYRLKQHGNRNLYLRAQLDTCADVYIMPASVYKVVF